MVGGDFSYRFLFQNNNVDIRLSKATNEKLSIVVNVNNDKKNEKAEIIKSLFEKTYPENRPVCESEIENTLIKMGATLVENLGILEAAHKEHLEPIESARKVALGTTTLANVQKDEKSAKSSAATPSADSALSDVDARLVKLCDSLKGTKLKDYELASKFNTKKGGFVEQFRGICSIQHYHRNFALIEDDDTDNVERLDKGTEGIRQFMKNLTNCLIFAKAKNQDSPIDDFIIIKKGENTGELEYFDATTKSFKILDDGIVNSFKLSEADRCIQIQKEAPIKINCVQTVKSPGKQPALLSGTQKPYFYHEHQTGSFCGLHATHAFFGEPIGTVEDYLSRSRAAANEVLKLKLETQMLEESVTDATSGTDPGIIRQVIQAHAKEAQLSEYQNLSLVSIKGNSLENMKTQTEWKQLAEDFNNPALDRVIVGYGESHFLTLRKSNSGQWHVIDSMEPKSQEKTYNSIEDALKGYSRPLNQNMIFIYPPPSIPAK